MDNYEIKKTELKIQVLSSVAGAKGEEGESMYEIAKKNGFEGTEQEFIAQYMNVDARIGYYECDTDSSTAAKTCQGASFILPSIPPYGGSFKVKFLHKNSAANPTLSINQSTPKPLYYNGSIASSTNTWDDGDVLDLYYDGTNFNATSVVDKFATGEKVKNVGIDAEPTAGSDNLVKSGGVYNSTPTVKSSTSESDFDISDEDGNVLVRFSGGHLQVKNFSSVDVLDSIQAILSNIGFDNVPEFDEETDYAAGDIVRYGKYVYVFTSAHTAGEWDDTEVEKTVINTEHPVDVETSLSDSDLDISDEDGNVLVRFSGGHFKTKYFNSFKSSSVDTSSKVISTTAITFTNSNFLSLDKPNLKNHYILSFAATVVTMGTISIEVGSENNWSKGRVDITPTSIVYYKYATWESVTIPHNITITSNIAVIIKTTKTHFAEIYLLANNSQTELFHQEISWNGCGNSCTITNSNGIYNNCTFALNCSGLLKDVWIFGDSYTDIWPIHLDEMNFDNFLLDGFSGRTSQQAYQSLVKGLSLAKPKAIVWMMGMNDADNGGVNTSWKTNFDNARALCATNKIEFIAATIPCVPQRNHTYKNAYIENSGVRIIPIATVLGATTVGSTWYDGLLGADNVHPSISGSLWIALTLLDYITLLQK